MGFRKAIFGIAAIAVIAAVAVVQPASAKSISRIGAQCSAGTPAYAIFMEQGSDVTLGFGATGDGAVGTGHVLIVDNGTTPIIDYTLDDRPAWTISTRRAMPRGFHNVSVQADNLTTGETCASTLSFRN